MEPESLDNEIEEKLLVYQIDHVLNLKYILEHNTTALDASDTGTGKTFTAIAVCAQMNLEPIIICPKSVMSSWSRVCKVFNIKPFILVNYETIRAGKYYINGDRVDCPYIEYIEHKEPNKKKEIEYRWKLEGFNNIIFIFDEVHKCTNFESLNGKLLYYSKNLDKYMLLLSATIADHPEKFKIFFYALNFIDPSHAKERNITYNQYMSIMYRWILRDSKPMIRIHSMLYPERASTMKIDVIGDLFPETQITAQPYNISSDRAKNIQKEYTNIHKEIEALQDNSNKDKANILVRILRAQQKIELLKVPLFVELSNDFIENGFSVVIFVNFTQTLESLSKLLYTDCLIYGKQTDKNREENIKKFMENKSKIIICNIKAGGTGISLDDQLGGHPRVSLISPTWNSIDLIQVLGRIHRAGSKSKSLQRIIYIANTIEEKISEKLHSKLKNINDINNGDVDLTNIDFNRDQIKF